MTSLQLSSRQSFQIGQQESHGETAESRQAVLHSEIQHQMSLSVTKASFHPGSNPIGFSGEGERQATAVLDQG